MTPQLKLIAAGATAAAVSKFVFHHEGGKALMIGLATISAIAILLAQENKEA